MMPKMGPRCRTQGGRPKEIVECLVEHLATKGTQMVLQTRDAHGLYEQYGFSGNSALMNTGVTDL
jgi:hypothetical protein